MKTIRLLLVVCLMTAGAVHAMDDNNNNNSDKCRSDWAGSFDFDFGDGYKKAVQIGNTWYKVKEDNNEYQFERMTRENLNKAIDSLTLAQSLSHSVQDNSGKIGLGIALTGITITEVLQQLKEEANRTTGYTVTGALTATWLIGSYFWDKMYFSFIRKKDNVETPKPEEKEDNSRTDNQNFQNQNMNNKKLDFEEKKKEEDSNKDQKQKNFQLKKIKETKIAQTQEERNELRAFIIEDAVVLLELCFPVKSLIINVYQISIETPDFKHKSALLEGIGANKELYVNNFYNLKSKKTALKKSNLITALRELTDSLKVNAIQLDEVFKKLHLGKRQYILSQFGN